MPKPIYILLLLATILFGACKKSNVPHYLINSALKAAFSFKAGTYWIYQDSISGEIDSFYVEGFIETTYSNSNPEYTYDAIGVTIRACSNNNSNNSDSSQWAFGLESNSLSISDWEKPYYSSGVSNEPYDIYYNYPSINYPFTFQFGYNTYYDTVLLIDDINVNGTNYSQVSLIKFTGNTGNSTPFNDNIYIDTAIGMIKIKLNHTDDTVFKNMNLIRYKLIK